MDWVSLWLMSDRAKIWQPAEHGTLPSHLQSLLGTGRRWSEEQSWLLWGTTNTINKAFGFLETNAFLLSKLLPRFQVTRFHTHFCSLKDKFIKKSWSCHTHLLSNVSHPGFSGFPLEEAYPFVLFGCLSLAHSILAMHQKHTDHPKGGAPSWKSLPEDACHCPGFLAAMAHWAEVLRE